jgi:antitoxin MazE
MSRVRVGKWGKSLAIRVPSDVAQAIGLSDGEQVEIEPIDGELRVRRSGISEDAKLRARKAMAELLELAKGHTLGGISIKDLINEGRR